MTERFERKNDCYLDSRTGLEWSLNNINPLPWKEAIRACADLRKGWKLPTIKELETLVNFNKADPITELPRMLASNYWSSTTYACDPDYAWYVDFNYGYTHWYYKSDYLYVRAVRGGAGLKKGQ